MLVADLSDSKIAEEEVHEFDGKDDIGDSCCQDHEVIGPFDELSEDFTSILFG